MKTAWKFAVKNKFRTFCLAVIDGCVRVVSLGKRQDLCIWYVLMVAIRYSLFAWVFR